MRRHGNQNLQRLWLEHGAREFKIKILERFTMSEYSTMLKREQYFIDLYGDKALNITKVYPRF